MSQTYRIKIDQLPEQVVDATDPEHAARQVGALIESHDALKKLHDDEPVEIKRPDGTPWGRNLTVGAFRKGDVDLDGGPGGPIHPPSV